MIKWHMDKYADLIESTVNLDCISINYGWQLDVNNPVFAEGNVLQLKLVALHYIS